MEKFTTIEAYHGKERKKLYISKDMEYTHFLAAVRALNILSRGAILVW